MEASKPNTPVISEGVIRRISSSEDFWGVARIVSIFFNFFFQKKHN